MTGSKAARLGSLERSVMEVLWGADGPLTAREVHGRVADGDGGHRLAYATVKTVLDRLTAKDMVRRTDPAGRALTYVATRSREDYVAELMVAALDFTDDRDAALLHFVRRVSTGEADALSRALRRPKGKP